MTTYNYTSRDYATIKSDLVARAAKSLPEWTDRTPSDFLMSLIEMWAYSADVLHYYIDRAAGESFLATATQRDSVLALANLYGYYPNWVTAATCSVTFQNDPYSTGGSTVTIPAGTSVYATIKSKPYYFYTNNSISVAASAGTGTVTCTQGVQKVNQTVTLGTGSGVSDGTAGQIFTLRDTNVAPSTISVNVYEGINSSPVTWRYDNNFSTSTSADSSYSIYVNADGYTQIIFGNGVNGRIPPSQAVITASYTVSDGSAGNVAANLITGITTPITNVIVKSSTAAYGGSEGESIDSIKANIPGVFRSQGRAVSLTDYEDIAKQYQGVARAKAVYAGSGATGGSVTVYVTTYQGDFTTGASASGVIAVDTSLRNSLASALQSVSMLGVALVSIPSTVYTDRVFLSMQVYVKSNYSQYATSTAVSTALDTLFSFDLTDFGKRLTIGEVYRTAMNVDGVDYVSISAFNTTNDLSVLQAVSAASTRLLQKGIVTITATGGVTPPT